MPRQYFTAESLAESTVTGNSSWPTKVALTYTPDANSTYWVLASAAVSNSSTAAGRVVAAELWNNGAELAAQYLVPHEVTAPRDWLPVFFLSQITFGAAPAAQTIELTYSPWNNADMARIRDARITLVKAAAGDQFATTDAEASTTAATYQTRTTLTFTPASPGDYLVLGYGELGAGGNLGFAARLYHATAAADYSPRDVYCKDAEERLPFVTAAKVSLGAVSNTFQLQHRSLGAGQQTFIRRARILALRLDGFDNVYTAETHASSSGTSAASYADAATLTAVPGAGHHLLLGTFAWQTASNTVSGYAEVNQGGSAVQEWTRASVNANSWNHLGFARVVNLAATSTDWKWRVKAETAGTNVNYYNRVLGLFSLNAAAPPGGVSGSGALAVAASVASEGGKRAVGIAAVSASAVLAGVGDRQTAGTATLSVSGALAASGGKQAAGAGAIAVEHFISPDLVGRGAGVIPVLSALTGAGRKQASASAMLSAAAGLAGLGGKQARGTATRALSSGLTGRGRKQATGIGAPFQTALQMTGAGRLVAWAPAEAPAPGGWTVVAPVSPTTWTPAAPPAPEDWTPSA